MRASAARALGEIGDERAIDALLKLVKEPKGEAVGAEATALGALPATKAVDWGIEALRDAAASVREAGALVLSKVVDSRAVERLLAALGDREPAVRRHVALALGELRDPRRPRALARHPQAPQLRRAPQWTPSAASRAARQPHRAPGRDDCATGDR